MITQKSLANLKPYSKERPPSFPVHTQKHPNGYLTPILKKLLNKEMTIRDPEVKKVLEIKTGTKAELKKIIMLRYILNAVQGDNPAIEGILDRTDGKISNVHIDQSQHTHYVVIRNPKAITEEQDIKLPAR